MLYNFVVDKEDVGARLDAYLSDKMSEMSRSRVRTIAKANLVTVNTNIVTRVGYFVKLNDEIAIEVQDLIELDLTPQNIPIEIIYEDDDIAIINKPKNLVVHPSQTTISGTLVNALLYHLKSLSGINGVARPGIVHRLDKDTTGALMVAKNDKAHLSLSKQLEERTVMRKYLGLVDGIIKEDEGEISAPIGRSRKDRKLMAVVDDGRESITKFKVLERFDTAYTLVEFSLVTGRTHQIRVHAKYIGHSVVGDSLYGREKNKFGLDTWLLHAYKLGFVHPTTEQWVEFVSEIPADFQLVLQKINNKYKK